MSDKPPISMPNMPAIQSPSHVLGQESLGGGLYNSGLVPIGVLANSISASSIAVWATTRASLDGMLGYPAGAGAYVVADPDTTKRGVYIKSGASGAGSWGTKAADLLVGPNGAPAEIQIAGGFLQWRNVGGTTWTNLVPVSQITGPPGAGVSLRISAGQIQSKRDDQPDWSNLLAVSAITGTDGKSVELQVVGAMLQGRQTGGAWAPIFDLNTLKGTDGKSVELQVAGTSLQARQTNGAWVTVFDLGTLKGAAGRDGGLYSFERPGEKGEYFTTDPGLREPSTYPGLDASRFIETSEGDGYVLGGGDSVISKQAYPVEPFELYRARVGFTRITNPSDPSGDGVRFSLICLNRSKTTIDEILLQDWTAVPLDTYITTTQSFSRLTPPPADVKSLPAGTRYVRLRLRGYGSERHTVLLTLSWNNGGPGGSAEEAASYAAQTRNFRDQAEAFTAQAAASAISAAQVAPNRTYSALIADTTPAIGTVRQVATGPNSGLYELQLVSGVPTWVRISPSVPGIDGRVTAEVATREALVRTVAQAYVTGVGYVEDALCDLAGRVVETMKGGVRFLATGAALLAQPYTVAQAYVTGVGYVDEAVIDPNGRVIEARRSGVWWRAGESGLIAQTYNVAQAYVPGVGYVDAATVDPNGRVLTAEKGRSSYVQSYRYGLITIGRKLSSDFDLVIYGGNLSGLMTAQRAAREGLSVAIIEPTAQTGGVISQGLTFSDPPQYGQTGLVGGLTRKFFIDIAAEYGNTAPQWNFEPHVYDRVFNRTLLETGARVIENSPIDSPRDRSMRNGQIEGIRTKDGWISCGWASDASYEMDLARHAGAPWQMGREAASEFGETMAGFRTSWGYSRSGISPNNAYPVQPRPPLAEGDADSLIQPYSFRTIYTNAPDRLPHPEPEGGYDPDLFTMMLAVALNYGSTNFLDYVSLPIVSQPGAPYLKGCANNPRLVGIELPGLQQSYPLGTWADRRAMVKDLRRWHFNTVYGLANDPRVPPALRASAQEWGLASDEYVNGATRGFPDWPYIRESIRLRGAYVMTEFDLRAASNPRNTHPDRNAAKPDTIAKFAYMVDSHSMALYAEGASTVRATGNSDPLDHDVDPYSIPYRALYTDPALVSHITNLLVSNCISATSVAWRSLRMEPNFGMLGEAAGEAVVLMRNLGVPVQNVPVPLLQSRLRALGTNI